MGSSGASTTQTDDCFGSGSPRYKEFLLKDSKAHSFGSYDRDAGSNYIWTVRVRSKGTAEASVYARNQSFTVCGQASFKPEDPYPSAVEYLLGALGADLASGFARQADRHGVSTDALEVSICGRLNNPLGADSCCRGRFRFLLTKRSRQPLLPMPTGLGIPSSSEDSRAVKRGAEVYRVFRERKNTIKRIL